MKAKLLWLVLGLIVVALAADRLGFGFYHPRFPTPPGGHGEPPSVLTREQANLIADMRAIGLDRDRRQMAKVQTALYEDHPFIVITALQALGRLGAIEAVKDIRALQRRLRENSQIQPFAALALARIEAESTVPQVSNRAQLRQKMNRFLNAAAVAVSQIHKGASWYVTQRQAGRYEGRAPFEVQALRQAAEIAGEAYQKGVADAFTVGGFNFSLDYAAQLKVQLAQMPQAERIKWLIESIARKKVMRGEDYYLVRALVDEGGEAVGPILAKLQVLRYSREGYLYPGIKTLFRVLDGIGDKRAIPVVRSFVGDKDSWLDYYARQSLDRLEKDYRAPYGLDY